MEEVSVLDVHTVLDAFSGTTRVSQIFAQMGLDTTANDISEWSEVFGNCYLKSCRPDAFYQEIIDMLNSLEGCDGWFTEHYGGSGETGKKPFQRRLVDPYCTYYRLSSSSIADYLNPNAVHTVKIRLLNETPDKRSILFERNRADYDKNPEKYKPIDAYLGAILLVGEIVKE